MREHVLAVTAAQIGLIDAAAVHRESGLALVRRAGIAIAAIVTHYRNNGPLVAFAGNGDNGGDAFAALAELEGPRVAYHDPAHDGSTTRVVARERTRARERVLRARDDTVDKRSSGAPLVIAGSADFPGAAILCAPGAARAGAGYATVAVPHGAIDTVRAHLIEQVVIPFDDTNAPEAIRTITDGAKHCNAIAIGPGLALTEVVGTIVRDIATHLQLPMVADASALHHLAGHLPSVPDERLVLTPHEGEFALVSGRGAIPAGDRPARLRAFVDVFGITTLLKGQTTLVADRTSLHLNPSGTSALATVGTGDVLSGIIATLLAQGLTPVDVGRAGARWHGRAGACAGAARPVGVIAGDIANALGQASHAARDGWPIRIF